MIYMDILPLIVLLFPFTHTTFGALKPVFSCVKPDISNSKVYIRKGHGKYAAVIYCSEGYQLLGHRKILCQAGVYDKPFPKCIAPGCKLPEVEGGRIESKLGGAVIHLSCRNGLIVDGNSDVFCEKIKWSEPIGVCSRPEDIRFCSFETPDQCGWTQDFNDNFDWKRNRGQTRTGSTGPSFDHTFGSDNKKMGHYMYIEASKPRRQGDVAVLRSPMFSGSLTWSCFRFFYHMFGPGGSGEVGKLSVLIQLENQDTEAIFEISGNQGDRWLEGVIRIENDDRDFQILLKAARGKSFMSDIAIDDLEFLSCHETYLEKSTERQRQFSSDMSFSSPLPSSSPPSPLFATMSVSPLLSVHTTNSSKTSSKERQFNSPPSYNWDSTSPTNSSLSTINFTSTNKKADYHSNSITEIPKSSLGIIKRRMKNALHTTTVTFELVNSSNKDKSTTSPSGTYTKFDATNRVNVRNIFLTASETTLNGGLPSKTKEGENAPQLLKNSKNINFDHSKLSIKTEDSFHGLFIWLSLGTVLFVSVTLATILVLLYMKRRKNLERSDISEIGTNTAFNVTYRSSTSGAPETI